MRMIVPLGNYKNEIRELEDMGEVVVRYSIADGTFFGHREVAEEWLRQKEAARLAATEAETLAIARESADAASRSASASYEQARWAKWAAAIAVTAAIISARGEIVELITKHL